MSIETLEQQDHIEDEVYEKLKKAIYRRHIRPSSKLVEGTIAERMGVSRTPVRAAFKKLEQEGFLKIVPKKGAFVVQPTIEEIHQAFAVRILLEQETAFLAAQHIEEEQIQTFLALLEEEKSLFVARDLENYYHFNDNFHYRIAELSGNQVLYQYVQNIVSRTTIFLLLFDPFFQMEINPSIDEHLNIVKALEAKNPEGCRQAMREHLLSALHGMKLEEMAESSEGNIFF